MASNEARPLDRTILVVDDYPANLLALEAVLSPLGFPIVVAGSGEEALRLAEGQDFALIIMDVHMPELDGYATVERLRERKGAKSEPVLFVTAVHDRPEHQHRGYALGAIDFVAKPFDTEVLCGKVRAIVELYARGQERERARSRELDRLKDLFLGAVGHDLRNPLHTIRTASQLLEAEKCSEASRRSYAQKIDRAALRMNQMIEDILDLTQSQFTGGLTVTRQPADLGEVARAVVGELRLAHPQRSIGFDVAGDVRGQWDASRLGRVVSNLVGNALQHGAGGCVDVKVTEDGGRVLLAVHNEGPPIAADVLSRLFEPFRRGEASSKGVGLGLFIVREIVRAHGGTVTVASMPGEGTTFRVELPKDAAGARRS